VRRRRLFNPVLTPLGHAIVGLLIAAFAALFALAHLMGWM
jgi:hypothetical protein